MSYLDYVLHFQRQRRQHPLPAVAADLYHHLLYAANAIGWKSPFQEGNMIIMATLGIADKTLMSAREKLVEAGLIKFTPGKKGYYSTYELLPNNTENLRGIREQSGKNNTEILRGIRDQSPEITPEYHVKSPANIRVDKKREDKEATASAQASEGVEATPTERGAKNNPLSAEPWAAWLNEHTPTVQRLKSPLTAEQYTKLIADFGEPLVREVLASMENHAGLLKKYTSANLTARDWCKRRCPNGQLPTPPPTAGPPISLELDVNEEFEAEQRARQQAEATERARQFRATYAQS